MIKRRSAAAVLLLASLVVPAAAHGAGPTAPAARPSVVVAIADTGVNPYHAAFHRPKNTVHPCRWLKGFTDCSIPALNLSVGKYKDYKAAAAADAELWDAVQPGQWYWIPRTNIIGAVCDRERGDGAPDPTCILDDQGHGTGTASSVLSEAPDALLLIHDGSFHARHLATAPVTPDVQSHSWGFPVPVPSQVTAPFQNGQSPCRGAFRRAETMFFLGAGNTVPAPSLLDCERQQPDVQVVGGAFPGYWEATTWQTFDFASWECRPVAARDSTARHVDACGTSFSAPTAAGAAAAALLRIRQHDRYVGRSTTGRVSTSVSRDQFVDALRAGASYTPRAKYPTPCMDPTLSCIATQPKDVLSRTYSRWAPLPPQAPYVFWGYGWLDSTVAESVASCALRTSCPAKPMEAQRFNEARQELRRQAGVPALGALAPAPQQDAGSSRDAGPDARSGIPIGLGVRYQARLEPYVASGDVSDTFTFRVRAGQRISVSSEAALDGGAPLPPAAAGCWMLFDPSGRKIAADSGQGPGMYPECPAAGGGSPPQQVSAPATGRYALTYFTRNGLPPHDYRFTVTVR